MRDRYDFSKGVKGKYVGRIKATHPGVILEYMLKVQGSNMNQLSTATRMPTSRINKIVHGTRSISPDTALRLERYFGDGLGATYWLRLQADYDLAKYESKHRKAIYKEVTPHE
jgi:addiction module HigA family antidote